MCLKFELQSAYKLVTAGKFQEAINAFEDVLHHAILLVVSTKQELNELQQVITIAREYLLGIKMEIARKDVSSKEDKESQVRNAELAAYFTHVGLQPIHLMLSLRSAMTVHYKLKNLLSASSFARRLLELGPKPEIAASARKLQAACDKAPQDDVRLNYSEQNPFVICGNAQTVFCVFLFLFIVPLFARFELYPYLSRQQIGQLPCVHGPVCPRDQGQAVHRVQPGHRRRRGHRPQERSRATLNRKKRVLFCPLLCFLFFKKRGNKDTSVIRRNPPLRPRAARCRR